MFWNVAKIGPCHTSSFRFLNVCLLKSYNQHYPSLLFLYVRTIDVFLKEVRNRYQIRAITWINVQQFSNQQICKWVKDMSQKSCNLATVRFIPNCMLFLRPQCRYIYSTQLELNRSVHEHISEFLKIKGLKVFDNNLYIYQTNSLHAWLW